MDVIFDDFKIGWGSGRMEKMGVDEKFDLITRNCEEVMTEEDLGKLIKSDTELNHYIGFEISGMVHLGTGLMCMGKVADFLRAGINCTILLADFHSYLNNKLGGNWDNIRKATDSYFKQGIIASLKCFGVNVNKEIEMGALKFVIGKDLYKDNLIHWETFMEVGKHITLARNLRSISIMGKKEGKSVDMATLFYPPLQVADIFTLQANLVHAGIDQRKAHANARDVATKLTINPLKNNQGEIISPVAVHNKTIAGLEGPKTKKETGEELKMSKSKPKSAIFVHDTPEEIKEKIKAAYCPPKEIKFNPIINWVETLIFWGAERVEEGLKIKREEKHGGDVEYLEMKKLKGDYKAGNLHPMDLKHGVANWLIEKLEPARKHFAEGKAEKGLRLMEKLVVRS